MENKNFNIIISGVGGQGLITLVQIINEAAFIEGYDVKSSELHGLSQRGGSVLTYIRFGKKIYSPLVENGKANLIIGMEETEGLRVLNFGNKNTGILINRYFAPIPGGLPQEEVVKKLQEFAGKNLYLVKASDPANVYLLGYAINKKLMPLKAESILAAIKNVIPEKFLDLNIKALELANHD